MIKTHDTIIALATPPGESALAVIRMSGSLAHEYFLSGILEKEKFKKSETQKIYQYTIINTLDQNIDSCTAIKYASPKSFTGEDVLEIFCHGSKQAINAIIATFVDVGCRYAKPGEFTRRAFYNKKLDLAQAESIHAIITSKNSSQLQSALSVYKGSFHTTIIRWRDVLEEILQLTETQIEFGDEDDVLNGSLDDKILNLVNSLELDLKRELDVRQKMTMATSEIDVVIAGPTNAGKSTIFNMLLGFDRSIVHSREGTTRDFITEELSISDYKIRVYDTAGLSASLVDELDSLGIKRSRNLIASSQIVLWITSSVEEFSDEEINALQENSKRIYAIINKEDLQNNKIKEQFFLERKIPFSSLSAKNADASQKKLIEIIDALLLKIPKETESSSILISPRQERIVRSINNELSFAILAISQKEVFSLHCKNCLSFLDEFVGISSSDDIINNIFDNFCIGK